MKDLKHCPFCGGTVYIVYSSYNDRFNVHHKISGLCPFSENAIKISGAYCHSLSEAVKAWNTRKGVCE